MSGQRGPAPISSESDGWAVVGTLLSGIVFWGGIGWLLDLWLDTNFIKAIGVLVGAAGGIYLVMLKVGPPGGPKKPPSTSSTTAQK